MFQLRDKGYKKPKPNYMLFIRDISKTHIYRKDETKRMEKDIPCID